MLSDVGAFDELLKTDPQLFAKKVLRELIPSEDYVPNWHTKLIVTKLEQCRRKEIRRLIVTLPPRSGKSILTSVWFPAFLLARKPTAKIITASYSEELATDFSNLGRQIMEREWYLRAFPGTRIDRRKNTERMIRTTKGGYRLTTSIGATLTGRGADFIIIDDPLNAIDASSETIRNRAHDWLKSSVFSRLNDKKAGVMVLVAQRLHQDDPAGRLLEDGNWELLCLPAIAPEDQRHEITAEEFFVWKKGEPLQPIREPLDVLDVQKRAMGSSRFAAQYLQSPTPPEGAMIKTAWLQYYAPEEYSDRNLFDYVVQSWDTASTVGEMASYSVGTTWGIIDHNIYVIDVIRLRCEFPELLGVVVAAAGKWRPDIVLVEKAASGHQLLQTLCRQHNIPTRSVIAKYDKVARMEIRTPLFENGQVFLPREADWLEAYREELTGFPGTKHTDQVDSTSQALGYINNRLLRQISRSVRPNPTRPKSTRTKILRNRLRGASMAPRVRSNRLI